MTSTAASSSRPMAGLPHHHSGYPSTASAQRPPAGSGQPPPRQLLNSPYNPQPHLLRAGSRNRLILSLRSGIPSEVDYALPRLVLASFDQPELFKLDGWVDSVPALLDWPQKWVEELEKEAALYLLRQGQLESESTLKIGSKRKEAVLALIPEWTRDPDLENRSTNSLLVLRNASFINNNASILARASVVDLITRFLSLPVDFLLDLSLHTPEPFQHILVILQSIFPFLKQHLTPSLHSIFATTLPHLLVESRDLGILHHLFPLLIGALSNSSALNPPSPPPQLIPYLLNLLTLPTNPPSPLLELAIDLLISLSTQSSNSRTILAQDAFPGHLRNLVILLEHSGKPLQASWETPGPYQGIMVRNPASLAAQAEEASQRRKRDRDVATRQLEQYGRVDVVAEVGDRPPNISPAIRKKLYTMSEPQRSIAWMHETFVYSSTSHVLQVSFWHAYRDFFQHPSTLEPLLSASEAIKNVTVAFPGAPAKIWTDERGEQKFVLAGLGFRKGSDDDDRFQCQWNSCPTPKGSTNTAELLTHIQTSHLTPYAPPTCLWATCGSPTPQQMHTTPFTLSHLLTHLPLPASPPVPDFISSHPASATFPLTSPNITSRPAPPLPRNFKLGFTGVMTPVDNRRHPTGVAFLAALLVRNLARTLRSELAQAGPSDGDIQPNGGGISTSANGGGGGGLSAEAKEEKKRHLMEERFGLPIPDTVLKEEEEEEKAAGGTAGDEELNMTRVERGRARRAFESVEERIVAVIEGNMAGLGQYLGEAFGFGVGEV